MKMTLSLRMDHGSAELWLTLGSYTQHGRVDGAGMNPAKKPVFRVITSCNLLSLHVLGSHKM